MREDLLHFLWKFKKIPFTDLITQQQEKLRIDDFGFHNLNEGPDFHQVKVTIDGQQWAGNAEMHLKSSDWYAHHHETDTNYENVVLHVVWEDDIAVFRKDGSQISCLELKGHISEELLSSYKYLMDTSQIRFINCEKSSLEIPTVIWLNWEERLYFERLEEKSKRIEELLRQTCNNWEAVLFLLLCRNFGTKVNGLFFFSRALQLDFSIIRKTRAQLNQLESLFFGHFGLLNIESCKDTHYLELQKEYRYLRQKFDLSAPEAKPAFFGMRPHNFPTIRISQLAGLYHTHAHLFQTLMDLEKPKDFYALFQVDVHPFWENHYTFGKDSKKCKKKISSDFIDLLIINTLVPLKFCYSRFLGKDTHEGLLDLISLLKPEKNTIVNNFKKIGIPSKNALQSQSRIQLYQNYCSKKRCLQCDVGSRLLNRNAYI